METAKFKNGSKTTHKYEMVRDGNGGFWDELRMIMTHPYDASRNP